MPIEIDLHKAGKKFFRNWIFRDLSLNLSNNQKLVVLGANGSGKSTLLQILSGQLSLSEGSISYRNTNSSIAKENMFQQVAISAPYLDLIEDFTLEEIIAFHFKFKQPAKKLSSNDIVEITGLQHSSNKVFKYYSSGMKQRVKLTLAMVSDVQLVLLDEPLTNLDKAGVSWYQRLAAEFLTDKMVVVCSNHDEKEYSFCQTQLDIMKYK